MKLSPRQLADAIGVSESSLKRWADAGKLAVSRTEGGHRRITMTEAVRFIRETGATVVRPDLLGLGGSAGAKTGARGAGAARSTKLARGADGGDLTTDAMATRTMLVARFLGGESFAALADDVVLPAIARIEERYARDARSELNARAAADAWTQAIAAVRGLCVIAPDAPLAIGSALAPSAHRALREKSLPKINREVALDEDAARVGAALRSAVVATAFAAEGLRVIDLGAHVGTNVMRAAVAAHEPAIAWNVVMATADGDGDADGRGMMVGVEVDGYRMRTMVEVAAFARGLTRGAR